MKMRLYVAILVLLAGLLLVACGGAAEAPASDSAAPAGDAQSGAAQMDVATGPIQPTEADGPAPRGAAATTADVAGVCLTPEEADLARRINEYRASVGLPAIPVSKSLTLVAQQHAWDSSTNGQPGGPECNMHSWTGKVNPALVEGTWSEVCYTSDHANAAGMWNKPREIAGYQNDGVENSHWASAGASAAGALQGWRNSPGHNAVITEQNGWGPFLALGVGIRGNYAHMWVARAADPAGVPPVCGGGAAAQPTAVPPTAVPPTAVPPTAVPPTAVPPTAVPPTAVPPTDVAPTAVPAATEAPAPTTAPPTAVPPTAVPATAVPATAVPAPTEAPPAAPTGELLNVAGTVAAGATNEHSFPVANGGSYTINVLPAADFDAAPAYSCTTDQGSRSGNFDLGFDGDAETTSFPINGNGTCTVTVAGYGGTGGSYTVVVTSP